MNKSKSEEKSMIEEFVEENGVKSHNLDQSVIDHIIEMKSSKNDTMEYLRSQTSVPYNQWEKYWTESGRKVSGGSGYRQRTVSMFLDSDGLVSKEDWEKEMIEGGYLKNITNYRQHFETYYHLYHHTLMN